MVYEYLSESARQQKENSIHQNADKMEEGKGERERAQ
jgi:hypothetical protein